MIMTVAVLLAVALEFDRRQSDQLLCHSREIKKD